MKQNYIELTRRQKIILLTQVFLLILFTILYLTFGLQKIVRYDNAVLRFRRDGDVTTYSGSVNDQTVTFTVSPGPVVEYRCGDTVYGPYTITYDPTAVISEADKPIYLTGTENLVGIEVRDGSELIFRGSYMKLLSSILVFNEQGNSVSLGSSLPSQASAPSIRDILSFAFNPNVVRHGSFAIYAIGAIILIFNAMSILYADSLFRFSLGFIIQNPDSAEPSEWELCGRWFAWIILTVTAFFLLIKSI